MYFSYQTVHGRQASGVFQMGARYYFTLRLYFVPGSNLLWRGCMTGGSRSTCRVKFAEAIDDSHINEMLSHATETLRNAPV